MDAKAVYSRVEWMNRVEAPAPEERRRVESGPMITEQSSSAVAVHPPNPTRSLHPRTNTSVDACSQQSSSPVLRHARQP